MSETPISFFLRARSVRGCSIGAAAWILAGVTASGCASAPAAVKGPTTTFEQKMAWMLQLEDQRVLRVESPPHRSRSSRRAAAALSRPPPPAITPDLAALIADPEARVRRRAAMAMGRVGLAEGVKPLTGALADADPEVREMAAFALGLIADASAAAPLTTALADASPHRSRQRGRSAGAHRLGPGRRSRGARRGRSDRRMAADTRGPQPSAPCSQTTRRGRQRRRWRRSGSVYALVRLHAYEALAAAVIDNGSPVTTWWPVAYALGRIEDPRAEPVLLKLLATPGRNTPRHSPRAVSA